MVKPNLEIQFSRFVGVASTNKFPTPLEQLVADATKRRAAPVFKEALTRLSAYAQCVVLHMATPQHTVGKKVETLPRAHITLPSVYDAAVSSVIAFAALVRFDEYVQDSRERRGLRRQYVNTTNMDLLRAIEIDAKRYGDDALTALVTREAAEFLPFTESVRDLRVAVRGRLGEFKLLI